VGGRLSRFVGVRAVANLDPGSKRPDIHLPHRAPSPSRKIQLGFRLPASKQALWAHRKRVPGAVPQRRGSAGREVNEGQPLDLIFQDRGEKEAPKELLFQ
jgi:hypothetical protein